jgi:hypothetical protein
MPTKENEYISRNKEIKNMVALCIFLKTLGIKIAQYINPLAKLTEIIETSAKEINIRH